MEWDNIKFMLSAVRNGSLLGAATKLAVSQPTVSRRLQTLEDELSIRLFDRLSDGWKLTAEGVALLSAAEQIETSINDFLQKAERLANRAPEPVRISSVYSICRFFFERIKESNGLMNGIALELISEGSLANLTRREADIAVRMSRTQHEGNLKVRSVGKMAFAPYAAKYLVEGRTLKQRQELPTIGLDSASSHYRQAKWLRSFTNDRATDIRITSADLRIEAAKAGLGIAIMPCYIGDEAPELMRICNPPSELEERIDTLVHENLCDLPHIRAALTFIADTFREHRHRLMGEKREPTGKSRAANDTASMRTTGK